MGNGDDEQAVKLVAEEIQRYLHSRSNAADTAEGIAQWWIMRQRLHEEKQKVERALEYLSATQLICKRQLCDGTIVYTATDINKPVITLPETGKS